VKTKDIITVIDSGSSLYFIDIAELRRHRYLLAQFVYRDFVVHYKQTILGPVWWVAQPLMMTAVFVFVFSFIAKLSTDQLPAPLFYLSGLIMWNLFAQNFQHISNIFLENKHVFQKVYFPRLIPPIACTCSNIVRFVLQFAVFVLLYLIYLICGYTICPSPTILLLPLLLIYTAVLSFGFGILTAALTVKYRDLVLTLPFIIQLWMFLSAVMLPLSAVPERWQFVFSLNPVVPAVETFRLMCFGTGGVSLLPLCVGIVFNVLVLFLGLFMFVRTERNFTDTI